MSTKLDSQDENRGEIYEVLADTFTEAYLDQKWFDEIRDNIRTIEFKKNQQGYYDVIVSIEPFEIQITDTKTIQHLDDVMNKKELEEEEEEELEELEEEEESEQGKKYTLNDILAKTKEELQEEIKEYTTSKYRKINILRLDFINYLRHDDKLDDQTIYDLDHIYVDDKKFKNLLQTVESEEDLREKYIEGKIIQNKKNYEANKKLILKGLRNDIEGMLEAFEEGADIHYNNDQTIHRAAYSGDYEMAKLAIEYKADLNKGALVDASSSGYIDIVQLLLENNAKPDINKYEALFKAKNDEIRQLLVNYGLDIDEAIKYAKKGFYTKADLKKVEYFRDKVMITPIIYQDVKVAL